MNLKTIKVSAHCDASLISSFILMYLSILALVGFCQVEALHQI
jgi:hypothetical protein